MRDDDDRPDRHGLLELDAILHQVAELRAEGDPDRFEAEARFRWLLHRLWIAAGNEAIAYRVAIPVTAPVAEYRSNGSRAAVRPAGGLLRLPSSVDGAAPL